MDERRYTVDLAVIAADEGISLEEAIRRYGWQVEFGEAVERIRGVYPEDYDYAHARMNQDGRIGGTPRTRSQFTPLYHVLANMELRLRTG